MIRGCMKDQNMAELDTKVNCRIAMIERHYHEDNCDQASYIYNH